MNIQRFFEKKVGSIRKFVKNLKRLSKSVLYLFLEQMIPGQEFGFIEILRMKKILQYKFGILQKKIKAP